MNAKSDAPLGKVAQTPGAKHRNRLALEKSPYLLQHAGNPVDWYPWGPEAFEKARGENKPVFLSIGYSTCHWCHVMEKESYDNEEVAKLMNEAFVSIKVDREERPDLDSLYMTVCRMMTGSGGWPLNIIMTPDRKPFYAATYIPKHGAFGRPGMMELVPEVERLWKEKGKELAAQADEIEGILKRASVPAGGSAPDESALRSAFEQLSEQFDPAHGGFGVAPKFPTPHNLLFLLRYYRRTNEPEALAMAEETLREMTLGGIYDHVGWGFHRYSTDAQWLVPHFEKMLYDQAQLATAYTEAFQATGKPEYARTARKVLDYVLRDMADPAGGFYSAEDADSEGVEGKFYVWTEDEIREVLGADAELVIKAFNVEKAGNWREQATGERTGTNILYIEKPVMEIEKRLEAAREKLFAIRERRVHPHKDDKVLADWNGLMIAALAKASAAFDEPKYAHAAQRAADFVLTRMRTRDGRLLHRWRDGEAAIGAFADDYAFLIDGLIELYEATFDVKRLEQAIELNAQLVRHFEDEKAGGFFSTADDAEGLTIRRKGDYDGATPAANSVEAMNLLRLARMTGDPDLERKAQRLLGSLSGGVGQSPAAHTQLLLAVDFALGPSYEVVIVGRPGAGDTRAMLDALRTRFVPNAVVLFKPADEPSPPIVRLAAFARDQKSIDGKATAYVCRDFACQLPTSDIAKMLNLLGLDKAGRKG